MPTKLGGVRRRSLWASNTGVPRAGAPYFSKAGDVVAIAGQLNLFLMHAGANGGLR